MYSMDNATSVGSGGTPRGTALRIRAKERGPKARVRAKERVRTARVPNCQEGSKEEKEAECHLG